MYLRSLHEDVPPLVDTKDRPPGTLFAHRFVVTDMSNPNERDKNVRLHRKAQVEAFQEEFRSLLTAARPSSKPRRRVT